MAHEIDTTTGRAAVFVTGEPAWHKLGTVVSEAQTSAEAIGLAGLDWKVEQRNIAAAGPNGWLPINGTVANVRNDTSAVLGIVSTSYRPFQNEEAFAFMDELVGEKLAMFETAGALKGGRQVWMMARLPQEYRVGAADVIKPYILLTNGHDGSKALRMIATSVRVVCNNTLNLALNRSSAREGICIYHFGNLSDRVNQARHALGIVVKRFEQFEQEANALAAHKLKRGEANKFFEMLVPDSASKVGQAFRSKALDAMRANLVNDKQSLPGVKGTAWAAYNSVSEYADWQKRIVGQNDLQRADNQLNSIWFGAANKLKQRAFEAALALAT